jgi:hypothetical protein
MIALLTFAIVASVNFSLIPQAKAGPLGDLIARQRQKHAMKLPAMDPPFSKKPIKDLNLKSASFTTRLKKRFSIHKTPTSGVIPFQDSNVTKASK